MLGLCIAYAGVFRDIGYNPWPILCFATEVLRHENRAVLKSTVELHSKLEWVGIGSPIIRDEHRIPKNQFRSILYGRCFTIEPHNQKKRMNINLAPAKGVARV